MKQLRMFEDETTTAKQLFKEFVADQKSIIWFVFKSPYTRRVELSIRIEDYFKL